MACHAVTYKISERRHSKLPVCPRGTGGTGCACLQQYLTKDRQNTLVSPPKNAVEKRENWKEKEK